MLIHARALFRVGGFRWLGASVFLNAVGMMGEAVVLGWLTLELTDSPFWVGVAMGARMLPLFFVGIPAGVLADRVPRHRLLVLTGAGQALTAAALGLLTLLGLVSLGPVLLLTFTAGAIRGVEQAARQSYTHDVVGAAELINAFAILGVAMRTGWLLGALGTGAAIAQLGAGAGYLVVAGGYLAGAAALLPASAPAPTRSSDPDSLWRGVVAFVVAVRTDRALLMLMLLTAGAEILGFSHQALLPSLARDILESGPEGLGALNASRSIGGILALVAATTRSPAHGSVTVLVAVLISFGASLIALGVAPGVVGFVGVAVVLIVVNAMGALADLLSQSLLQLSMPDHLRGQAGGAWVVAIGLAPLGQFQIGALASLFGVSIAFGASGVALAALASVSALLLPRARKAPAT